ncbi:MAG: AAA family ATPase [Planctomycetota bacterium]
MSKMPMLEPEHQLAGLNLLEKAIFPHPVQQLERIDTHISIVILTGDFAYKLKKPVDMGFVDYTSLEKRKHFCELEIDLNQRFAPALYLGVVPVIKTKDGIRFGCLPDPHHKSLESAQEDIIDYAVLMRQFSQSAIVANRLTNAELTFDAVESFGRELAAKHDTFEAIRPDDSFAQPQQIVNDAIENFSLLINPLENDRRSEPLRKLEQWTALEGAELQKKFESRLEKGKVKRCHGDLHLKNIIQLDGELIAFDGIEFNESFQCIDVFSEVAFPVMDFMARGRHELGWRLLNAYLEWSGDYADLEVLRFYLVYRAMVRVKVAWLNPANHSESRRLEYATEAFPDDPHAGPWDKFITIASFFAFGMKPKLAITHGFSGSGKSTVAMRIIDDEGGIRIRSDVLRHQLADQLSIDDKYSPEMSDIVYNELARLAKSGLNAHFPMIADATFLKRKRREAFQSLANEFSITFEIIDCVAPFDELCQRLELRTSDPSEADVNVLKKQMKNHDPISVSEKGFVKTESI